MKTSRKEFWNMSFEEFSKAVRAQCVSRPRFPPGEQERAWKQRSVVKRYFIYVNRESLDISKTNLNSETFRSEDTSWYAKQAAWEYIKKRADELELNGPRPKPSLTARLQALSATLKQY